MSKGVNKVILLGNLGQDPELRTTRSGTSVCNLRIATGERRKQGDEWVDHTEWHSVVCFGGTADAVSKYLSKGSQVHVIGRMQTRDWEDRDGNKRWTTEVIADDVTFVGSGNSNGTRPQTTNRGGGPTTSPQNSGGAPGDEPYDPELYDKDIPF